AVTDSSPRQLLEGTAQPNGRVQPHGHVLALKKRRDLVRVGPILAGVTDEHVPGHRRSPSRLLGLTRRPAGVTKRTQNAQPVVAPTVNPDESGKPPPSTSRNLRTRGVGAGPGTHRRWPRGSGRGPPRRGC